MCVCRRVMVAAAHDATCSGAAAVRCYEHTAVTARDVRARTEAERGSATERPRLKG